MQRFSKTVAPHFILSLTQNVFQVLSTKLDVIVPKLYADDIGEASGPVTDKEEVSANIRKRSVLVIEVLQYVAYLYR